MVREVAKLYIHISTGLRKKRRRAVTTALIRQTTLDVECFDFLRRNEEEWKPDDMRSGVTSISIEKSTLDTECFDFLDKVSNLQEFEFSHAQADNHPDYKMRWWEPAEIIQHLLEYASHSIVSLDLTKCHKRMCRIPGSYPEHSTFVGSLTAFQILADIRIDRVLFVDTDMWDGESRQDVRTQYTLNEERSVGWKKQRA